MKIFFGKIKSSANNKQIQGAYYETFSPMKLGELQVGDYAFIISGKEIHLWRAKERLDIEGHPKMNFEVIISDLPLNSQKFVAFKYFRLDSSLIVLTIRQSPKAFYKIELTDPSFTEEMLVDRSTYDNEVNFRKIKIYKSRPEVEKVSTDVQLYFGTDGRLNIEHANFFDKNLFPNFIDNLSKLGNGRKMKDIALEKILRGKAQSVVYTYSQLPILRMYDALFNEYGNPDDVETIPIDGESTVEDLITQPLELKSFNQIYYGPPGTGKTYLVRKNFCLEEEITETIQTNIKIDSSRNFWHLAPGRNGYLWDQLKEGDILGYEWVDKDWGDLFKLTPKHIEEEGWGSYQLISYLREVKKGDYICVISGRRLFGIAEVTRSYDYAEAIQNNFAFQTVPIKWLKQFEEPVYLNSSQTKTFVRLNNGTRWATLLTVLRENGFYFNDEDVTENRLVRPKNFSFITFHQSFSYEDFIEGIKPVLTDSDDEGVERLQYEIVTGVFYQACERSAQLAGYATLQDCLSDTRFNRQRKFKDVQEYYLIIDELNRGNVASIFGELITLIEDDKRMGANSEIIVTLPYSKNMFGVPSNLRIIGTMNSADRSVEALDTALRRRFSFEEIGANPEYLPAEMKGLDINLRRLLEVVNERLEKILNRDHTLGHAFFISVADVSGLKHVFANKVIPLLQEFFYNDYAKIGLIIGVGFLNIKKSSSVFMKVDQFDASDIEDRTVYSLRKLDNLNDDDFLQMIKSIYE